MQEFIEIPKSQWEKLKAKPKNLVQVFLNDEFLVQVYDEIEINITRLSINKVQKDGDNWQDGITWEELQEIKRLVGYGDKCAVEIFPPDNDLVNVSNMRHLWLVEPPQFMWKKPTTRMATLTIPHYNC